MKLLKSRKGILPIMVLTLVLAGAMILLFSPAIIKVWEFTFFTDFDFGNPVVIAVVIALLLILLLRKRREQ